MKVNKSIKKKLIGGMNIQIPKPKPNPKPKPKPMSIQIPKPKPKSMKNIPSNKGKFFIRIHRIGYIIKEINKEINFYDTSGPHEYSPKRYEKAVYNQFYTESFEEAEKIKNDLLKEKVVKHNIDFTSSIIPNIPKIKSEGFMAIEKVEIYNDSGSKIYINDEIKEEIKAAKELIKNFKENNDNNKSHKGGSRKKKKVIKEK